MATICLALAGCHAKLTPEQALGKLSTEIICIGEINCQDQLAARIFKDGLASEFLRQGIQVCEDEPNATIIITGNIFMAPRTKVGGLSSWNPGKAQSVIGVESASLRANTNDGKLEAIVISASGITIQNAAISMCRKLIKKLR